MTMVDRGRIEYDLTEALRVEVLSEIDRLGLSPEALAQRLSLMPTAVRAVLDQRSWSLKTALVIADGLDLPLVVKVDRLAQSA